MDKLEIPQDTLDFLKLKSEIIQLLHQFIDESSDKIKSKYIVVDVLTDCLEEAQYKTIDYYPLTSLQKHHVCYQVGEWYLMMKPLLEIQHNLGLMKEKLKMMICGD